jgi:hypothetical protein
VIEHRLAKVFAVVAAERLRALTDWFVGKPFERIGSPTIHIALSAIAIIGSCVPRTQSSATAHGREVELRIGSTRTALALAIQPSAHCKLKIEYDIKFILCWLRERAMKDKRFAGGGSQYESFNELPDVRACRWNQLYLPQKEGLMGGIDITDARSLVQSVADQSGQVCFANPGTSEKHLVAALDGVGRNGPYLVEVITH